MFEVTFKKDQFFNIHDLIADLTQYLELTPEQQFRVTAKIKRYVHTEKASVFHRYFLYSQGHPIFDKPYDPQNPNAERKIIGHQEAKDPWINSILKGKYEQHRDMANDLTDEQLVTWDVGTHKYRQGQ